MAKIRTAGAARRRPILQIQDLQVYYGESHALQGVSLTLERGILSVVGRNGMGKTTLCNTIVGLMRARSGAIRFEGRDISGSSPHEIARVGVGFVPQGRRLWPSLSVDETLRLCARRRRRLEGRTGLFDLSAAGRAREQRRRSAIGRRAADAGDIAGAAGQSAAACHGRADRGLGADHRCASARSADPPGERRGFVGACRRAEHRRRDLCFGPCRDHGQWSRQPRSWTRAISPPTASCSSGCLASAGTARRNRLGAALPYVCVRRLRPPRSRCFASRGGDAEDDVDACLSRRFSAQPLGLPAGRPAPARAAARGGAASRCCPCRSRSASAARRWSSALSTPRARNCASSAIGCAPTACRCALSIFRRRASRRAPTSPRCRWPPCIPADRPRSSPATEALRSARWRKRSRAGSTANAGSAASFRPADRAALRSPPPACGACRSVSPRSWSRRSPRARSASMSALPTS